MTNLSPAAQAVLDAYRNTNTMMDGPNCAAVLRAVADQVVPSNPRPRVPEYPSADQAWPYHEWQSNNASRRRLLAIADELEGTVNRTF